MPARLYALVYDDTGDPAEAFRRIETAREHGPIAMGTHGPELLSY